MAAVLAALMITQGSFTAFADEIGPGYDEQNKASTDTSETDPANAQLRFGAVSGWPEPAGRLYAFTSGNLSADLRTDPEADGQHP